MTTFMAADDGATYVQVSTIGDALDDYLLIGNEGDPVILKALIVPDDSFVDDPGLRSFSAAMAISPKNGKTVDLPITADQPYIMDELPRTESFVPPSATIENMGLMYYVTN